MQGCHRCFTFHLKDTGRDTLLTSQDEWDESFFRQFLQLRQKKRGTNN